MKFNGEKVQNIFNFMIHSKLLMSKPNIFEEKFHNFVNCTLSHAYYPYEYL